MVATKPANVLAMKLDDVIRYCFESAMSRHNNDTSLVARDLGVCRTTVYNMAKRYGASNPAPAHSGRTGNEGEGR